MPPVVINLVAAQSDTGKTTVLEGLLPELKKRGLRVAALKGNLKHYDSNLDLPGKDSWRFARAGAAAAGLTTRERFLIFGESKGKSGLEAAAELLGDFDLIIVEGGKGSKHPKIEVVRGEVNPDPLLPENTVAVITDRADLELGLPLLPLGDNTSLADFICTRFLAAGAGAPAGTGPGALTHFDGAGRPRMVDVSAKESTVREAYARGEIEMAPGTLELVRSGGLAKGDVLGVAQVAAIMAVKETGRLIPMAHPLGVSAVEVDFETVDKPQAKIEIGVRVKLSGQTGVEMEALTGVGVAALTIYDMCKAVDKTMVIGNIRLEEKKGGRSGHYRRGQV